MKRFSDKMSDTDKPYSTHSNSTRMSLETSPDPQTSHDISSHTPGLENTEIPTESVQSGSELYLTQQLQAAHDHIAKLSMEKIGLGAQNSKFAARISELESESDARITELTQLKEQLGQMPEVQNLLVEIDELQTKIQGLNQYVEENESLIASAEEEKRLDDLRLRYTIRGCEQMFVQRERVIRSLSQWPQSIGDLQDMVNTQTAREGGPDPDVEAKLRQGKYGSNFNSATKRDRGPNAADDQSAPSLPSLKRQRISEENPAAHQDDDVPTNPASSEPTLTSSIGTPKMFEGRSAQALTENSEIEPKYKSSGFDKLAGLHKPVSGISTSQSKPKHVEYKPRLSPRRTKRIRSLQNFIEEKHPTRQTPWAEIVAGLSGDTAHNKVQLYLQLKRAEWMEKSKVEERNRLENDRAQE